MDGDGIRQRHQKSVGSKTSSPLRDLDEEEAVKRASRGWIWHFLFALGVCIALPPVILIILPSQIEPVIMERYPEPPELTDVMKPNNLLHFAERVFENELEGPESIVVDGEHIYTGTSDGCVTHIHKGQVRCLVRFGEAPCGGYMNEVTCGRPLGLRMGKDGLLIALDAYHGIFKVNVATGDYTILYSSKKALNGKMFKFFNDLDIGDDGKIYFTDSSSRWQRNTFTNIIFEGVGTGRLMEFNPETGDMRQLMDGLIFANGVQFTRDRKSLLVADTVAAKIYKYNLLTDKVTVWSDNLPGLPDNIRYCRSSGTYWVGSSLPRYRGRSLVDSLSQRPWIRKQLAKIITVTNIQSIVDSLEVITGPPATKAIAMEFNEDGKIIRSLQDTQGKVLRGSSEIACHNGVLYFGSFKDKFIGRLYKKRLP